jgi:hypothetical protein
MISVFAAHNHVARVLRVAIEPVTLKMALQLLLCATCHNVSLLLTSQDWTDVIIGFAIGGAAQYSKIGVDDVRNHWHLVVGGPVLNIDICILLVEERCKDERRSAVMV